MRKLSAKFLFIAGFSLIGSLSLLSISSAQTRPIGLASLPTAGNATVFANRTSMDAKTKFIPAAFIMVEHEVFSTTELVDIVNTDMSITRQAFVSVRGLPGESVYLTCGIERQTGWGEKSGQKLSRDCDGAEKVGAKHMMSGESADSEIWLTDDLLPDQSGNAKSSIAIEVTYI